LPSCSCIALKPLRLSRMGQRVGRGHAMFLHRCVLGLQQLCFDFVSRDTPHARVSVSYVLETSLLNDRCQRKSGGKPLNGSELHARFLAGKYNTEIKHLSQCLFRNFFVLRKHDSRVQGLRFRVVLPHRNQLLARVAHLNVLSVGPISFSYGYVSSVIGPSHVFGV